MRACFTSTMCPAECLGSAKSINSLAGKVLSTKSWPDALSLAPTALTSFSPAGSRIMVEKACAFFLARMARTTIMVAISILVVVACPEVCGGGGGFSPGFS